MGVWLYLRPNRNQQSPPVEQHTHTSMKQRERKMASGNLPKWPNKPKFSVWPVVNSFHFHETHTHTHCREVFEMWAPCFAHLLCSLAWKQGLSGDAFNFHSYWIMNTTVISLKDSDFAAKMLQLFNNSIWLNACFFFYVCFEDGKL